MAVESPTTPLGSPLALATLSDLDGRPHDLEEYRSGGALLVAFVWNHCPYVQHIEQSSARSPHG